MEELLKHIEVQFQLKITSTQNFKRFDYANDNLLLKLISENGQELFYKEIPSHSLESNLELIYRELNRVDILSNQKFLILHPLTSKDGIYLQTFKEKHFLLFPYIRHSCLNKTEFPIEEAFVFFNWWFQVSSNCNFEKSDYKNYRSWFKRAEKIISKKFSNHPIIDQLSFFSNSRLENLDFKVGPVHFDLNPFNLWKSNHRLVLSDFDNALLAEYAKDIFDLSTIYLSINDSHFIDKSDFYHLLNFSSKYIKGINAKDCQFFLARTKLGQIWDENSLLTDEESIKILDNLNYFLELDY